MELVKAVMRNQDKVSTDEFLIIGAGLPRTGTLSTWAALNKLGYKCYHYGETFLNKGHNEEWYKLCLKKLNNDKLETYDWSKLLKYYKAGVDAPICLFYPELLNYYKNAKIILTVRDDGSKWYQSYLSLYGVIVALDRLWFIKLIWREFRYSRKFASNAMQNMIFGNDYYNVIKNKENCIQKYNEWNDNVIKSIPKERLLVFNVKQGFGPLCKFLNIKDIPTEPFPHLNQKCGMKVAKIVTNVIVFIINAASITISATFVYKCFYPNN